jgi:hypothetical protein
MPRSSVSGLGTGVGGYPFQRGTQMPLNIFGYIASAKEYGKPRVKNIAVLITGITATAQLLIYQSGEPGTGKFIVYKRNPSERSDGLDFSLYLCVRV